MNTEFKTLTENEMFDIEGGFVLTATLFTIWGVAVTGMMCLKAGAVVGLAASAIVVLSN